MCPLESSAEFQTPRDQVRQIQGGVDAHGLEGSSTIDSLRNLVWPQFAEIGSQILEPRILGEKIAGPLDDRRVLVLLPYVDETLAHFDPGGRNFVRKPPELVEGRLVPDLLSRTRARHGPPIRSCPRRRVFYVVVTWHVLGHDRDIVRCSTEEGESSCKTNDASAAMDISSA
jgi:hypothetical protein